MRTTLEIDDDLMVAVRDAARLRGESLGRTVSDWMRRGLTAQDEPDIEMFDGIPVLMHPPGATQVTSELVRALTEDE
jgi:hypothetical protein